MKKMQRRSKVDKDGKPIEKDGKKDKDGGRINLLDFRTHI